MIVFDFKVARHPCSIIRLVQNAVFAVVLNFCDFFLFKEFLANFVVFICVFIFQALNQDFHGQPMILFP